MIYFHGTDTDFKAFNLIYAKEYKDFVVGIYLAEEKSHAYNVAIWKCGLRAYVYTYEVSLTELRRLFKILEFRSVSLDFIRFY